MIVVFSNSKADAVGKRLWSKIQVCLPECPAKLCSGMDMLQKTLCRPRHGISIAILVAATLRELKELILIEDLLENIRVILVLPDRNPTTLYLGVGLKTSFLSYIDSDFNDVISVLNKILNS